MKLYLFCGALYLLIISTNSFAQTFIRIEDKSSHSALPLATIVNLTKALVRFADENGSFLFKWHGTDSIKITHIGYYDTVIQFQRTTNNVIQLRQKPSLLPNVIVRSCKNRINLTYNNFNPLPGYSEFGGLSWEDDIKGAKVAIIVQPLNQEAQLTQLEFELKKIFLAPKELREFPQSPIRFSFYSIDEETKLPLELLTNQTVIFYPKRIGRQTLNVDSLHLAIPDSGLYIAIEYLVESKYCFPVKFGPSAYKDSIVMQYPLMFDGIRSKGFRTAFYDYRINKWNFANDKENKEFDKVRATIKFGIGYTYCNGKKK